MNEYIALANKIEEVELHVQNKQKRNTPSLLSYGGLCGRGAGKTIRIDMNYIRR